MDVTGRCHQAAQVMGMCQYSIRSDIDAGYWQIKVHKGLPEKTAFFVPEGKKDWKNMQTGIQSLQTPKCV